MNGLRALIIMDNKFSCNEKIRILSFTLAACIFSLVALTLFSEGNYDKFHLL